ncbi:MAG: prepilin-type N-terminal cleavage/methylation domain-containing protein [Christensenella sp.]
MFYRAMLKKENARKEGKRAFTLIELIIVIAIIGILVAILVPTMLGFVDDAKAATGLANARTVYSAATAGLTSIGLKAANGGAVTEAELQTEVTRLLGKDFKAGSYTMVIEGSATAVTGIASVTYTDLKDSKITGTYPVPAKP